MSDGADADTEGSAEEPEIWSRSGDGPSGPIGESGDDSVTKRAKQFADDESDDQLDSPEAEEPAGSEDDSEGQSAEPEDSQGTDEGDEEIPAKEDSDRFEHWQSKYQRAESKLGFKPDDVDDDFAELVGALHNNPEYLQRFVQFVTQGGEGQPTQGEQPSDSGQSADDELTPPERPEKPANYSSYDAYNEPESDSWAYREKMEEYRDAKIRYQDQRLEKFQEMREQEKQQRTAQAKQQQVKRQWRQKLTSEYDFDNEQVDDFFKFMNRDQFQPEEAVRMYRAYSGLNESDADVKEKKRRMEESKKKKEKHAPSPASSGGSGNQQGGGDRDDPKDNVFGRF